MIKIEHLRKEYPTVTPLRDVNTVIRDGDVISVIGPSGTGKSTLLTGITDEIAYDPAEAEGFTNCLTLTFGEKK